MNLYLIIFSSKNLLTREIERMCLLTTNFVLTDTKIIEWRKQGESNSADTLALYY